MCTFFQTIHLQIMAMRQSARASYRKQKQKKDPTIVITCDMNLSRKNES
jgi:hypothetical protein